jgi:hypothetical protein
MGVGSNLGLGLGLGLAQQYNGNSIVNVNGALLLLLVHGLSIDGLHRAAYSFWSLRLINSWTWFNSTNANSMAQLGPKL